VPSATLEVTVHRTGTLLAAAAVLLALAACGEPTPPRPDAPGEAPPEDPAAGVVEQDTDAGRAAAELTAEPDTVAPGEPVDLVLVNHGEVELGYGRPVTVERWDGEAWAETDESREAAWTMELLLLAPGQAGEAQTWPFSDTPEEGWYRLTKTARAEGAGDDVELGVRALVQVTG
jgi:hypothetical protein